MLRFAPSLVRKRLGLLGVFFGSIAVVGCGLGPAHTARESSREARSEGPEDLEVVAYLEATAAQRAGRLEIQVRSSAHPTDGYEVQIWRPDGRVPVISEMHEAGLTSRTIYIDLFDGDEPLPAGTYLLVVVPYDRGGMPHGGHTQSIELVDP